MKKETVSAPITKFKDEGVQKLKLLFTIVERSKATFYADVLEEFEVNLQTILYGYGTASNEHLSLLGNVDNDKAVILSVIRASRVRSAMATLEEKFAKVKNGKGIAFTVPFNSVMGVWAYRFLSNTKDRKGGVSSRGKL
ncbi:MAG: hypothetical protein J6R89_02285 [Clostridia bacterium]|nr:hypothetical protein [Clostridia bacterium]